MTEVEQLIEKQLSALSNRLTKVSAENAALKRELEELRAKSTLSDETKAELRALLETPAAPGDAECEQGIGGACLATLEADGADMVLAAKSGTITFETEECSKTDLCTVITAVRAMLAAYLISSATLTHAYEGSKGETVRVLFVTCIIDNTMKMRLGA